jgi:hypothetical protein
MDKRYQVFISSTFTDLQEERAKVQQAVMELECIPAGMEAFPAIDEDQFEFIKKVIDDCDYYLLVIGGRYGSVSEEVGLSYTEMEYDYAVSKGIKVIVFLHEDPDSLPVRKSEQSDESKKKLSAFRQKASTGRLVRFWSNADELPGLVSTSLSKTIRTYPAVGWVRANTLASSEVYKELNDIRKENDRLKEALTNQASFLDTYDIAGLSDVIAITIHYVVAPNQRVAQVITRKWSEIFLTIAPSLFKHAKEGIVRYAIARRFSLEEAKNTSITPYADIEEEDIDAIRIQLRALDLINISPVEYHKPGRESVKERILTWSLTATGEKLLIINNALRRAE